MANKKNYSTAEIEIIKIKSSDIIATSPVGSGKDDMDDDGWTTVGKNW